MAYFSRSVRFSSIVRLCLICCLFVQNDCAYALKNTVEEAYSAKARVRVDKLNVREGPSKDHKIVGQVMRNQILTTQKYTLDEDENIDEGGDAPVWFFISDSNGKEGWVSGDHVQIILSGDKMMQAVKFGYLAPYTLEEDYPSIGAAFESFFERPSWNFNNQDETKVIFKGVAYIDQRPARFDVLFGSSDTEEIVIESVHINDAMCYSRLEELVPGGQNYVNSMAGMVQMMAGDLRGVSKSREKYYNTLHLQDFLAAIYLSK